MKRTITALLLIALISGFFPSYSNAAMVKDGYTLTPTLYGKNGVDVSSSFILTTPGGATTESVVSMISIDGQPLPAVTQNSETEFLITPEAALFNNTLYIFRLAREEKGDITWAFQTADKFEISSSLPADKATNVPVNSGIEITFSSDDYTAIDSYFSISPGVEGRFEYHKDTAVFVPNSLEYKTVYTVTIKAGVKNGNGEEITKDYVFSFETDEKPEEKTTGTKRTNSVYFYSNYAELPSIEPPAVKFYVYKDQNSADSDPEINVYKFGGSEEAIAAARKLTSVPGWSRYAKEESYCDTASLNKVASFTADLNCVEDRVLTLPDKLSQGYYLVEAVFGDSYDQIIIQISDIPVQVVAGINETIIWVNDISTGKGVKNAEVYDAYEGKSYKTDKNGVVTIGRALTSANNEQFTITAPDGRECTWFYTTSSYYANSGEAYWKYLQLDRSLFQRDDSVSFWGFVQNRSEDEDIKNVTAVLTQGYGVYGTRDILQKQVVSVQNDTYSGEITLPNLDAGTYCLSVYHGDILLSSTYITVKDYVKPAYTLEVSADKNAVFADEAVNFTVKAAFFEGTGLPGLDISYSAYGYSLTGGETGGTVTDTKGEATVEITASPLTNVTQGQANLYFYAEATLPEIGQTTGSASVRVFINDIAVKTQAKHTDGNATLTVGVSSISLDKLNNGTASGYNDYLGGPVEGKNLSVEIYRRYWTKEQTGIYYDYIEKKSRPTYRYIRNEEVIDRFSMVTGGDGGAEAQFAIPARDKESYYAKVTCTDGNGRVMTYSTYIGEDYSYYYQNASRTYYYLDTEKESYDIGEEVTLTLKRGEDTVETGNFLFVNMQMGILSCQAGENPYTFTFSEDDVPNVYVYAYYFNGYNYILNYYMIENICYDYTKSELELSVSADKDAYSPGDMCTVTVTAKDQSGPAKEASINISVVDEALFALKDYSVDPLTSLYRNLSAGLRFSSATHRTYTPSAAAGSEDEYEADIMDDAVPESSLAAGGSGSTSDDDAYLRETFKDTAFFYTIRTNEDGEAVYTFQLPDNITSWRLTVSGISNDLHAGTTIRNIIVTSPMFINYSLNDTFLTGDTPVIGINLYGSSLSGGESIGFEVWDESTPDIKYTASGAAFERINIPLWEMTSEGTHALIIKATVGGTAADMVRHEYQVFNTYRQIDTAQYYDVTSSMVFETGSGSLTNITFTDKSRGQYLYQLINMRYAYGDRIEKLVARREANKLLAEYFPDLTLYDYGDSFDPMNYQQADGGIGILPYASSDVETTVRLMEYIKDDININSLKSYLYGVYYGDNSANKMCALYGLALLKEPALLDLDAYAQLEDISTKDAVYVALGYCALGETQTAEGIYDTLVAPNLEHITPYCRVNTGADNDDILAATSAANVLAAKLEKPEREGLYKYCINNYTQDVLIQIEKLAYIETEIGKAASETGSITYTLFGEQYTRQLKNGGSYTLRIPARNMDEFELIGVSGDVGAVSTYKIPFTEASAVDNEITVRRRYYEANEYGNSSYTFEEGDLVRVQIWIDYSAKDVEGSYCVTDYLPSGLEYVSNSAKIGGARNFGYGFYRYVTVEGQKITFYDYNRSSNNGCLYYYYARVINPGAFRAEGTIVQNLTAKDYISVGQDDIIVIK